ncbi:YjbQ family protein [Rhodobacterales bacterium HKCCE2091]|nr:YjbQ family protein [Rhodobacterales bacterium HKCCE2091]
MPVTEFLVPTRGPGLFEFTSEVEDWMSGLPRADGVLTLMIRHTSASLLIQENASYDVRDDIIAWLTRAMPWADHPSMSFITHRIEGPDDMPAHIRASHMPVSLSVPVQGGHMMLGTWQGLFVVEHRARAQRRRVAAHFAPDVPG